VARIRPHPVATITEPVRLSGAIDSVPRAFVRCTGPSGDGGDPNIEPSAARAKAAGWHYRELPTPHDPQLFDPVGTARVLEELAGASRATVPANSRRPAGLR
jgi:hypothetical protein